MRLVSILWLALLASGCPDSSKRGKVEPKQLCTERGAQCKLASGVLGVCNDAECPAGQSPPCLVCVSQH